MGEAAKTAVLVSLASARGKAVLFTRKTEIPAVWLRVSSATVHFCECAVVHVHSLDSLYVLQEFGITPDMLPHVLAYDTHGNQVSA